MMTILYFWSTVQRDKSLELKRANTYFFGREVLVRKIALEKFENNAAE